MSESTLHKGFFSMSFGWKTMILFHLGVVILRLLYISIGSFDLDAEEAQYWLWSKHLDWSYYSKPPLIAYINGLSSFLFGDHTWTIRFNAIFTGALIGLAAYYVARKLYGSPKLAFCISAGLLLLPAYHYVSFFFTTDGLVVLSWLFTCYFFWRAMEGDSTRYWLLAGISMGLGLLAKYALLYFIPFSLLYLFVYKRELLLRRGYYLFLFTGLLIFLPVILWNIQYGMSGALHVAQLAGAGKEFPGWGKLLSRQSEFIGGQLLLNLPLLCLIPFWKKYRMADYLKGGFERLILGSVIFVFVIFIMVAFRKRIYINWLLFSYIPMYMILLKAMWQSGLIHRVKGYLRLTSFLMLLFLLQPVFAVYAPAVARVVPAGIDPFRNLADWKAFGGYLHEEITHVNGGKDYIIISDRYQTATELSFYVPGNPDTYCLPHSGRRMNQYDIWGMPSSGEQETRQAVLVKSSPLEDDEEFLGFIPLEKVIYETYYKVVYKGKGVRDFYIYLLEGLPEITDIDDILDGF